MLLLTARLPFHVTTIKMINTPAPTYTEQKCMFSPFCPKINEYTPQTRRDSQKNRIRSKLFYPSVYLSTSIPRMQLPTDSRKDEESVLSADLTPRRETAEY